jgi:hypothetical protein
MTMVSTMDAVIVITATMALLGLLLMLLTGPGSSRRHARGESRAH